MLGGLGSWSFWKQCHIKAGGEGAAAVIEPAGHESRILLTTLWPQFVSLLFGEELHAQRNWFDMEVSLPGYYSRGGLINYYKNKREGSS